MFVLRDCLACIFQSFGELYERQIHCITPALQFNNIQASLTALTFANKALRSAQAVCQIELGELASFTKSSKRLKEQCVFASVYGLVHWRIEKNLKRQEIEV